MQFFTIDELNFILFSDIYSPGGWPFDLNTPIRPPNTQIPFNLSHTFTPIHFHSSYTHNLLFQVYPHKSDFIIYTQLHI